ncbi:Hypothetical protein LUCI_1668 [Lucifera butyrica]|uniref:Uncharacterized protein n=1 Tax=Lucifera butyrica TaxID=1351585 RepID=A0A498R1G8_9FIRM|nr:hypothetical protein [Lucifera butyrica]VBB06436.1 Hypothetical protein LUCI_1668 [Lucifera butyrica]
MNEMDEFFVYLQTGIANLYHYASRAEELCTDEQANFHERIVRNDAWRKLENAIEDLENLAHKMMSHRVAGSDTGHSGR